MVVPARNCSKILKKNIMKIDEELGKISRHEIIIAEDGSNDGTDKVALELASKIKTVRCITSRQRKGKGKALKDAFRLARGDVIAFIDADLSPDISCFVRLLVELDRGIDVAIGSRKVSGADSDRNQVRDTFSFVYNSLVNALFGIRVFDVQCGLKAFKRDVLPVALAAVSNDFVWDTEFIVLSKKKGLRVEEVPIRWRESKSTSQMKLVRDAFQMLVSLLNLKIRLM